MKKNSFSFDKDFLGKCFIAGHKFSSIIEAFKKENYPKITENNKSYKNKNIADYVIELVSRKQIIIGNPA